MTPAPLVAVQTAPLGWLEDRFVQLGDAVPEGPLAVTAAVIAAVGLGAAHALAPGHGKLLIAAYLVGSRAGPRDALRMGSAVAVMHCASVVVLGTVLSASVGAGRAVPWLMPWLTLAAGLLVMAVGVGLLRRQPTGRHWHSHAGDLRSRRGLVVLGLSGGLLPSPSAFLVLSSAIFAGRAPLGFLMVGGFSVGLAATLALVALGVLHGRERLPGALPGLRMAGLGRKVPLLAACAVLAGGVWLTAGALTRL